MVGRWSMRALLAAVSAIVPLAGCAPAVAPPSATSAWQGPFAALSLLDDQIARATLRKTEHGTLVRALPRFEAAKPATFLTYKALDNNLGLTLPMHLNILERAGSSASVHALAFTDDIGPKNTFKYYLRADQDEQAITSPYMPASARGDMDTGSETSLAHAVRWGFSEYPSRLRWLDINNHGGGYKGIAEDDRKKSIIRLPALARAMRRGAGARGIDLVSFDACLMATAEVAYELRDAARVMVASEDVSYALGMNVDRTLAHLAAHPEADSFAVARSLALRAERKGDMKALYTVSVIDLGRAAAVAAAVDRLAGALLAALPAHREAVSRAIAQTPAFYVGGPNREDFDHRDLSAFVAQLARRVPDADVHEACRGVEEALFGRGGAVRMTLAAPEQNDAASGLSIYLPSGFSVDPIYRETAFAKATRWDEFLAAMAPAGDL